MRNTQNTQIQIQIHKTTFSGPTYQRGGDNYRNTKINRWQIHKIHKYTTKIQKNTKTLLWIYKLVFLCTFCIFKSQSGRICNYWIFVFVNIEVAVFVVMEKWVCSAAAATRALSSRKCKTDIIVSTPNQCFLNFGKLYVNIFIMFWLFCPHPNISQP